MTGARTECRIRRRIIDEQEPTTRNHTLSSPPTNPRDHNPRPIPQISAWLRHFFGFAITPPLPPPRRLLTSQGDERNGQWRWRRDVRNEDKSTAGFCPHCWRQTTTARYHFHHPSCYNTANDDDGRQEEDSTTLIGTPMYANTDRDVIIGWS